MKNDPGRSAGTRGGRWLPLIVAGLWILVAITHLLGIGVANLWVFAPLVYGLVWFVAIAATVTTLRMSWRRRHRVGLLTLLLAILAAAMIVLTDWESAYVHGFHWLHRSDFEAVSVLAAKGALSSDDYYGDLLPPQLQHLSANGRAAWLPSVADGPSAVFLPAWTGIPDGAVGFAYSPNESIGDDSFDCFGDVCTAEWALGEGWYWLK